MAPSHRLDTIIDSAHHQSGYCSLLTQNSSSRQTYSSPKCWPIAPVALLSPSHMLAVRQKCKQVKVTSGQISSSDNASNGLRMNRMRGEQSTRNGHSPKCWYQETGQLDYQTGCQAMKQHVDQMVSERSKATQPMVKPETENAKWPKGTVRTGVS